MLPRELGTAGSEGLHRDVIDARQADAMRTCCWRDGRCLRQRPSHRCRPGGQLMINRHGLRLLLRVTVIVTLSASLVGQATKPERNVEGNIINSAHDPRLRIELPASAQYVGADRWILF